MIAKIADICSLVTDGKHGDCENELNSGYFFLSCKDVRDGKMNYDNPRQITEHDFKDTHRRTNLSPGDVLITNSGTIGRLAVAPDHPFTFRTTFQKSVAIIKPKKDIVDSFYLYYYLNYKNRDLVEFAGGTTQKNLLLKDIRAFDVELPDLATQKKISARLKLLDDKIELNRKMNETMELMARAIFRSWFIDFDPVRAKSQGKKPFGMDDITAALFPNDFEQSESEEIPKGWIKKNLLECVDLIGGGTPKTSNLEFWDGDIPWFSVVDSPNPSDLWVIDTIKKITKAGLDGSSTKLLRPGTTIISARGTVGNLALVGTAMTMNQSCYGIQGKQGFGDYFTYFTVKNLVVELKQNAHGSVFDTITTDTFKKASIIVPSPEARLIERFENKTKDMLELIKSNVHESRELAKCRDLLLPRLLSGELPTKEVL